MEIRLPPRGEKRTKRVLMALSLAEYSPLERLARERDEPIAVVARTVLVEALKTLGEGA